MLKKIVVIGGGTGTHTVLSGLKKHLDETISVTAIVTVADSGGSTGRLRDEFGYLPVGDFRMALVALAEDSEVGGVLRDLFLHRFDKGDGLKGHNFGNLFLVAMTDILGSEKKAIEATAKILRIQGKVLPIAHKKLILGARYEDGTEVRGESLIDEPASHHNGEQRIIDLWIEPDTMITSESAIAIEEADLIVLGPGDLYTSTLANVVVKGAREAIERSKAKVVSVVNLMSKYGQTHDFTVNDYINELERYSGVKPHHILINTSDLPADRVAEYESQQEFPIIDDCGAGEACIIRDDFLATEEIKKSSGDTLKRSLIRHDSDKLAEALMKLL